MTEIYFDPIQALSKVFTIECKFWSTVIDLKLCMRKVKYYRKTSLMIIIGEHGSK